MNHFFSFSINNQGTQSWYQQEHDGPVTVAHSSPGVPQETIAVIPPGDMVMLVNLYRYVKENDIRNDFINPGGRKTEDLP